MIPKDHPLVESILNLIPINNLSPRLQGQVLAEGEILEYRKRKILFEEGERDPYTLYLLDGQVELKSGESTPSVVKAGDENARRALAQLQPRRYTARTVTGISAFRIERAVLDHILTDEQVGEDTGGTVQVSELEEDEEGEDWMTRLLSSELFRRLPHDNIQRFFTELEAVPAEPGQIIVEQGTQGDYLYIVAEGKCAVSRRAPGTGRDLQLAVLKEGDTFGEESLISNAPRNASVKMLTDGFMMRLAKRSFEELVSRPALKAVTYSEACKVVEEGGVWLDVRFEDEHRANAIDGSVNIPLNALRLQASKLDDSVRYIVYCDTGARSSTGAFLLLMQGLEASYLAGGFDHTPLGQKSPPAVAPEPVSEPVADEARFEAAGGTEATPPSKALPEDTPSEPATAQPEAPTATPPAAAAQRPSPAALAAAKAELEEAREAFVQDKRQFEQEISELRTQTAAISAERDKIAARGKQAADAAREFKRRFDELTRAFQAERSAREAREKELAAAKADAERQGGMEKARLEGELEKLAKKLQQAQEDAQAASGRSAQDLERLEGAVKALEQQLQDAVAVREEMESARVSSEAALEEQLETARAQLESEQARATAVEQELEGLRSKVAEARESTKEALRDREELESELQKSTEEANEKLRAEQAQLEAERARLQDELEQMEARKAEAEAALSSEREAFEAQTATLHLRAEELDRREVELADHQNAATEELAAREAALARVEAELSEEKSAWQTTVEEAIAEERTRLEATYAKFREEATQSHQAAARELVEQREAEIRAEYETQAAEIRAEIRAEHEAREAKLQTAFESQALEAAKGYELKLAQLRTDYETRLAEQAAMLEDSRCQLEKETVRFRAALNDAQRVVKELDAGGARFEMSTDDGIELLTVPGHEEKKPRAPKSVPKHEEVPEFLTVPGHEDATPSSTKPRFETDADGKARVLGPAQLAEIRRRMEEKMQASKRRSA